MKQVWLYEKIVLKKQIHRSIFHVLFFYITSDSADKQLRILSPKAELQRHHTVEVTTRLDSAGQLNRYGAKPKLTFQLKSFAKILLWLCFSAIVENVFTDNRWEWRGQQPAHRSWLQLRVHRILTLHETRPVQHETMWQLTLDCEMFPPSVSSGANFSRGMRWLADYRFVNSSVAKKKKKLRLWCQAGRPAEKCILFANAAMEKSCEVEPVPCVARLPSCGLAAEKWGWEIAREAFWLTCTDLCLQNKESWGPK